MERGFYCHLFTSLHVLKLFRKTFQNGCLLNITDRENKLSGEMRVRIKKEDPDPLEYRF
jgi:hypothetical protein